MSMTEPPVPHEPPVLNRQPHIRVAKSSYGGGPLRKLNASIRSNWYQTFKPTAFIDLNHHLVRRWFHEGIVRRWHGLDLRAIDGSTLRLPDTPLPRSVRCSPPTALRRRGSRRSTIPSTASFSTP